MTAWTSKLTEAQQQRICELAAPGPNCKRRTAGRIAQVLGVSKDAVAWFMYRNGLKLRSERPIKGPYRRKNGSTCRPFTPEEDALIERLSSEGRTRAAIAAEVKQVFGYDRRATSIRARLVMLAGFEAAAEEFRVTA